MLFLQILLVIIGLFLLIGFIFGWIILPTPSYRGPKTDHFDGKFFSNPGGKEAEGLAGVFKFLSSRKPGKWTRRHDSPYYVPENRVFDRLRVTFVNHSTFLLQFDGLNVLTDPVFSERISPYQWAGPRRMRPVGIKLADLPPIDLILLSHNHYDHLDLPALKAINARDQPPIVTALGVGLFLQNHGFRHTTELDWDEFTIFSDKLTISATRAHHFSGRGSRDRNRSGWVGFVLKSEENGAIYFAGDTGYGSFFKEIGEKHGPFRLAILPIGAYLPRWFMSPIHVAPIDSVQVFDEIGRPPTLACHFGTFALADDGEGQAEAELRESLRARGISDSDFAVPSEGVPIDSF